MARLQEEMEAAQPFRGTNAARPRPRRRGAAHRQNQPNMGLSGHDLRAWATGCPLWRWRAKEKVTREAAAELLGVGVTTIWGWEHGDTTPGREALAQLVELLGPTTVVRWVRWMAKRPGWGDGWDDL